MKRPLALALVTLVAGCAENAILEVRMPLREKESCAAFAVVDARAGEGSFDGDWAPDTRVSAFPLALEPTVVEFSLEDEGAHEKDPIELRVRLCGVEACDGSALCDDRAPRTLYVAIERAFYRGAYTSVELDLSRAKTEDERDDDDADQVIERCEVAGCTTGAAASYCFEERLGPHFCE